MNKKRFSQKLRELVLLVGLLVRLDRLEIRIVVVDLRVVVLDCLIGRLLLGSRLPDRLLFGRLLLSRLLLSRLLLVRHNVPTPVQVERFHQQIGDRHLEEQKRQIRHQKRDREREQKLFQ